MLRCRVMNQPQVSLIRIPTDLSGAIADLAEAEGVSYNEVLRRAVKTRVAHVRETNSWAAEALDRLTAERDAKSSARVG